MIMKKNYLSLGLIAAVAFTLAGCTEEIDQPIEKQEPVGIPFELVASTAETKTANDGLITNWKAGDAISVYHAAAGSDVYGTNDEFTITAENLSASRFTGTLTDQLNSTNDWYIFYPYIKNWNPATTSSGVVHLGSKYNEVQTQEGNNSMSHLAGSNYPLYGKAKGIDAAVTPSVEMSHLMSVLEVVVTNTTSEPLTVNQISFTAPESIIGGHYISIAGAEVVYTPNGIYNNVTATLEVDGGAALANGSSAKFYIGIKPFDAEAGETLTLSVNGYAKEKVLSSDVTFAAGKIKTMNFNYDKIVGQTVPYTESFAGTQGLFSINDVTLDTDLSYVWSTNSGYIKASAYKNSTNYASESWLISPYLDLSSASSAYLSFEHAANYFTDIADMKTEVGVKVRKQGGDWNDVDITYPDELGWNFVHSGFVSLASYIGNNVQVAFVYTSTEAKAGTWEVRNFKVDLKKDQIMTFSTNSASAIVGDEFEEPVLTGAMTDVTYTSSNTDVATVASDGSVTLKAAGETTITATAVETAEYNGASASYTIVVTSNDIASVDIIPNQTVTGNESTSYVTTETAFETNGVSYLINNWNPSTLQVRGNQTTQSNLQSGANFYIHNTTAFPGDITRIEVTYKTAETTLVESKIYAQFASSLISTQDTAKSSNPMDSDSKLTWSNSTSSKYFAIGMIQGGTSGTAKIEKITIYYKK